jgi:hypothetical protein
MALYEYPLLLYSSELSVVLSDGFFYACPSSFTVKYALPSGHGLLMRESGPGGCEPNPLSKALTFKHLLYAFIVCLVFIFVYKRIWGWVTFRHLKIDMKTMKKTLY